MKTIILTFLLCFAQSVFAQNITSALIGHAFSNDSTIAFYFNIHSTSSAATIPTSDFDVTVSDLNSDIYIPITNYKLISQVKEYIGCDTSNFVWMHQYAAQVNLTDSAYSALSNSCEIRGELIVRNRLGGSTCTDALNKPMYVYDEFDICAKDLSNRNTHRTTSNGIFYSCLNQPTFYSLNGFDIAEFDSLSYELVNPMIDRKTSTTYKTGNSSSKPIDVATSTQFTFDSELGDFTFQPSDTNQNMASVAVKTNEWRKDASSVYKKVGSSTREVIFVIDLCPINTLPEIRSNSNTYEVCEGEEICFTVSSFEHGKTPPPPHPKPKIDSVTIKWNRSIPSATFTIIEPKEINQRARFCWTPKVGEASKLPYTFVATARDNFCPTNGQTSKAFSIYVMPKPEGNLTVWQINDSSFSVKVNLPTAHDLDQYSVDMTLLDIDENPILESTGFFKSSARHASNKISDTVIMRTSSKFIVKTKIENKYAKTCGTQFRDTFNFHTASTFNTQTNQLRLFPNPTTGIVNLDYTMQQVEIRNNIGELIWYSDDVDKIDLSLFPAGIYTVSGLFESNLYAGKVIKY